jgi:hypothetical protein
MFLIDYCYALVSCNCRLPFSLYLMNNKYFAVFLPSLGIDEKLFHLGELIMKIHVVVRLHVDGNLALTDISVGK